MTIQDWLKAKQALFGTGDGLSSGSKILLKWWELSEGSSLREQMETEANTILNPKERK